MFSLNTSLYKIEHEFCPIEDLSEIVTTFLDILEHNKLFRNDKTPKSVIEKSCYVVAFIVKNMHHS